MKKMGDAVLEGRPALFRFIGTAVYRITGEKGMRRIETMTHVIFMACVYR